MKTWIKLIMVCLMVSPVYAGMYQGKVIDNLTGEGLPGAIVLCRDGSHEESDEQGYFAIETDNPKVTVNLMGYEKQESVLQEKEQNIVALSIKGVFDVRMVKVKAKRDAKKAVVSKQFIEKEAIRKTTTTLFPDVARVVQTLPGVTTDSDFSGLLYVRGGAPNEVVATLDDMIMLEPYLWGGRLSVFNPNMVDEVEFFAGGYPAEINQGLSGYMQVKNKTGNPDRFEGFLDLSAATANVLVEGPLGLTEGSSFIFGLRRTHYDLIIEALGKEDLTYPYFYDGQVKMDIPLESGMLSVQSLFSYEGMNFILSDAEGFGDDHDEDTRFHYLQKRSNTSISYDHKLSERISMKTLIGLTWVDAFMTFTDFYMPSDIGFGENMLQARHIWQALYGDNHIVKAGLYLVTGVFTASVNSTVKTPTVSGYHTDRIERRFSLDWPVFTGLFIQDDMEVIHDKLFISPGVNVQYYSENKQWSAAPRFVMKWKMLPDWAWHMATGLFTQHPMSGTLLDEEYGNPELKAQEAIHYIAGTKIDIGDDVSIQVEGFYKDYRNLIAEDAAPDVNYTNNKEGYAYGADLIIRKKITGNWDGWLTYSYVRSDRKITNKSNPENFGLNPAVIAEDEWFTSENERPHALSLILNYTIYKDWKIALTQKYMSGTVYTPVVGARYAPAIDEYVPEYGEYNSERIPAFMTTDLKLTMPFFGLKGWTSYLQVTNAFDNKNVEQYYYNEDYSEKKALYQLPRMVIGGIKWEF